MASLYKKLIIGLVGLASTFTIVMYTALADNGYVRFNMVIVNLTSNNLTLGKIVPDAGDSGWINRPIQSLHPGEFTATFRPRAGDAQVEFGYFKDKSANGCIFHINQFIDQNHVFHINGTTISMSDDFVCQIKERGANYLAFTIENVKSK